MLRNDEKHAHPAVAIDLRIQKKPIKIHLSYQENSVTPRIFAEVDLQKLLSKYLLAKL
jgi:hypothetical protein